MVSKEEYLEYVKKTIDSNDKGDRRLLSVWYLVAFIILIIIGSLLCLKGLFQIPLIVYMKRLPKALIIGVVMIILSIVMIVKRNKMLKFYRGEVREKLIAYLLKDNSYYFDKSGWISSLEFEASQFSKRYDCFTSGDLLCINIPNDDGSESKIDLAIADVNAYDLSIDEEGNRTTTDVYKGMFGYVKFKKKFKCILAIDSKYKRRGVEFEKVVLEDINFNKRFKITSNNQVEARYILTPDMMEKISLLDSKIKGIKIVFVDRYVYIGSEKVNMFELSGYKLNNDLSMFENLYDEIEIILGIVEELKNNNKVFKM
jgi:hypothetical protein